MPDGTASSSVLLVRASFAFHAGLGVANELGYGVGAVQIDDEKPVGGELVFCEWSMREFYALW